MFGLNLRVVTKDGEKNVPVTPKVSVEFESWLDDLVDVQMVEAAERPLSDSQ